MKDQPNILIVDDTEENILLLKLMLKESDVNPFCSYQVINA